MSRATVRSTLAAWIAPPNVTGIYTVYASAPGPVPTTGWTGNPPVPGVVNGCVAILRIDTDDETRTALGGPTSGIKCIKYQVEIHLYLRHTNGDAINAQAALDTAVENLKIRLRADRRLGTAGGYAPDIWEAAEKNTGYRQGDPGVSGNVVDIWAMVPLEITEYIQS